MITKDEIREWIRESVFDAMKSSSKQKASGDPNELLTAKEAATFIGDAMPTFYKRISEGVFPTYGGGKRIFVKRSDLINWLSQARTYSKEQLETDIFSKMAEGRRK